MKCQKCGGQGWTESFRMESNREYMVLSQCPDRCNITNYSAEVQKRLNQLPKAESEKQVFKRHLRVVR